MKEKEHKNPLIALGKKLHRKESDSKSKKDQSSPKSPRVLPIASVDGSEVPLSDVISDQRDVKESKRQSTASEAKSDDVIMHQTSNGRVVKPEDVELKLITRDSLPSNQTTPLAPAASANGDVTASASDATSFVTIASLPKMSELASDAGSSVDSEESEHELFNTPM